MHVSVFTAFCAVDEVYPVLITAQLKHGPVQYTERSQGEMAS